MNEESTAMDGEETGMSDRTGSDGDDGEAVGSVFDSLGTSTLSVSNTPHSI